MPLQYWKSHGMTHSTTLTNTQPFLSAGSWKLRINYSEKQDFDHFLTLSNWSIAWNNIQITTQVITIPNKEWIKQKHQWHKVIKALTCYKIQTDQTKPNKTKNFTKCKWNKAISGHTYQTNYIIPYIKPYSGTMVEGGVAARLELQGITWIIFFFCIWLKDKNISKRVEHTLIPAWKAG